MPTTIKLKNSVTTTNTPTSLAQGEVAINITDKKVWVGNAATTPIQLLGAGGNASFGALTCTSLTNSGLTSGRVTYASTGGLLADSANLTFNGTTLTAAALTSTGVATFSAGTVSAPAITTTGDTNTGIFFPAADTIAFTEGGAEAMRIDSSGNVGIGTSSPTTVANRNLQVYAGSGQSAVVRVTGNAGTGFDFLQSVDGTAYVWNRDNTATLFGTNNTERMRIDSAGRVQIGASNPATAQFSVQGGTGSGTVAYFGSSNANLTALAVRNNPSNNTTMLSSEWSSTATNLLLGIGGTEYMRIATNGSREYQTYGASGINTGETTIAWGNVSSTTFDITTLFPDVIGLGSGVGIIIQLQTWTGASNSGTSVIGNGARASGSWAWTTVNNTNTGAGTTVTFSGSGNVVTISFSFGSQYGKARIMLLATA